MESPAESVQAAPSLAARGLSATAVARHRWIRDERGSPSDASVDGATDRTIRHTSQSDYPLSTPIRDLDEIGPPNTRGADIGECPASTIPWNERPGARRAVLRRGEALRERLDPSGGRAGRSVPWARGRRRDSQSGQCNTQFLFHFGTGITRSVNFAQTISAMRGNSAAACGDLSTVFAVPGLLLTFQTLVEP